MSSRAGRPVVLLACLLAASPVAAQVRVGASGSALLMQHRVFAGNGVELSSGPLYGGGVFGAVGQHVEFAFEGASGKLNKDSAQASSATLSRAEGHVAILPVPWLALRAGAGVHTFSNAVAVQRWTTVRVGGEARLRFVGGAVAGLVRFELYPIVDVTGLEKPSRAFGAASGLQLTAGALLAELMYTFERYDFPPVGGVTRAEQLSALTVSLGLRLGSLTRRTPPAGEAPPP